MPAPSLFLMKFRISLEFFFLSIQTIAIYLHGCGYSGIYIAFNLFILHNFPRSITLFYCPNFILVLVPTIFNTSFHFLLTYFRSKHIIMIETGFLSSKILFAHRWRLISDRLENIVRSPEASNKCPARKFRPCRMAGLFL